MAPNGDVDKEPLRPSLLGGWLTSWQTALPRSYQAQIEFVVGEVSVRQAEVSYQSSISYGVGNR